MNYTVYALALDNQKYYVGITSKDILDRFNEHCNGVGSSWTQLHKPSHIVYSHKTNNRFDEDKYTFILMAIHGIDHVRGGSFTNIILSEEEVSSIENILAGLQKYDLYAYLYGHHKYTNSIHIYHNNNYIFIATNYNLNTAIDNSNFIVTHDHDLLDDLYIVLTYIHSHGYERVKSNFCVDKDILIRMIHSIHNSCFKCGSPNHYASECSKTSDGPDSNLLKLNNIFANGQYTLAEYYCSRNKDNILFANNHFYIFFDDTTLWTRVSNNQFICHVSHFIKKIIHDSDIANKTKYYSKYTNIWYIEQLLKLIKGTFEDTDSFDLLDSSKDTVNFKNGILCLRNLTFRERCRKDYVTKCLDYDYSDTVNQEISDEIKQKILHIANDDQITYDFILSWFGYCLTGETQERKMLFMSGYSASNGKSTLGRMFMYSLPIYSTEIDNQTFNLNYTKIHKQLNGVNKPIRFIVIEELSKKNIDVNLFKKFIDGNEITNEVLYGTTEKIIIHGKLFITSNYDPSFITDNGILRRGIQVVLKNKFLDQYDYEKITQKKGIYLQDKSFEYHFKNNYQYKLEFVRLLLPYAQKYYSHGLHVPDIIKNNFYEVCENNDYMKNFIEKFFTITHSHNDRISKDDFLILYNDANNTKMQWNHLLPDIKRIGLVYDKNKRVHNSRGIICGIKYIEDTSHTTNSHLDD